MKIPKIAPLSIISGEIGLRRFSWSPLGIFCALQPEAEVVLEPGLCPLHPGRSCATSLGFPTPPVWGLLLEVPSALLPAQPLNVAPGLLERPPGFIQRFSKPDGGTEGQGQPPRRDVLREGGCLLCVKFWVGSDRSFPVSLAVIVKEDE